MSHRNELSYLDDGPSTYKKAEDNLYYSPGVLGDYRGLTTPSNTRFPHPSNTRPPHRSNTRPPHPPNSRPPLPSNTRPPLPSNTRPPLPSSTRPPLPSSTRPPLPSSTRPSHRARPSGSGYNDRRTRSTGERSDGGSASRDRDNHVWVDGRINQSNHSNDNIIDQSNHINDRRLADGQGISHEEYTPRDTTATNGRNVTAPRAVKYGTRTRSLSCSSQSTVTTQQPHPRPREPRSLRKHSDHTHDSQNLVVTEQPKPKIRTVFTNHLATSSGINLPTPNRENIPTPSRDNPPTPSRDNPPTPNRENPPTPRRENLPTPSTNNPPNPSRENPPNPSRENLPAPSRQNPPTPNTPIPSRDNLPARSGDNLPTPSRENLPAPSRDNLPTPSRENLTEHPRGENSSTTGSPPEEMDSNMNRVKGKHRLVKLPDIVIENEQTVQNSDPNKPPLSPRIRQLQAEAGSTRNPLLGNSPRIHSLDEPRKKSKVQRTISAPELRQINNNETCFDRKHTCVDDGRELRVEHEPRSSTRGCRKNECVKGLRSKSLPIVSVPRPSKRHYNTDTDPLRYFAYLGKRFQFRERQPSAQRVISARTVILTSTSVISPQVTNNFRSQLEDYEEDDDTSKHQGACQDFIDCCTCMCCVKALFYHCTKDYDSEGDVSEHPCTCSNLEPYCLMRWSILGMLSVCMPCLFCFLPIQGCKKTVEFFRRKENAENR